MEASFRIVVPSQRLSRMILFLYIMIHPASRLSFMLFVLPLLSFGSVCMILRCFTCLFALIQVLCLGVVSLVRIICHILFLLLLPVPFRDDGALVLASAGIVVAILV